MPTKFYNLDVDTTLGGNSPSDNIVPSQKAIKTYVDNNSGGGSVAIDGTTITKNGSNEIQAVAVIDQNTGIAKTWTGTQAEYDAIVTKDPETEYIITDDIGGPATVIAELAEAVNDKVDKGHQVIEFQEPTSANGYTWYRKYADGWVEQGGVLTQSGESSFSATITFPIVMIDNNYNISFAGRGNNNTAAGNYSGVQYTNESTTSVGVYVGNDNTTYTKLCWQVSGMAA